MKEFFSSRFSSMSTLFEGKFSPKQAKVAAFLFHWGTVILGVIALVFVVVELEEHLLEQTNQRMHKHDQSANLRLSASIYQLRVESNKADSLQERIVGFLPAKTDGVINPLWPWVASFFAEAELGESEEFFQAGKQWNVWVTLVFLAVITVFFAFYWSSLASVNLTLLIGLAAFLPRAPYFQPEPLYYILFFLAWMLAMSLQSKNSIVQYALFAVCVGLAWLAKSSALLLLLGLVLTGLWRCVTLLLKWRKSSQWKAKTYLLGLLVLGVLLAVLWLPRYQYAKQRYGDGLFSYPSAWMWFDHFGPGYDWMEQHSQATKAGQVPPKPPAAGVGEWIEQHGVEEFSFRLGGGTWQRLEEVLVPKPTKMKRGQPVEPWRNLLDNRGKVLLGVLLGSVVLVAMRCCGLLWQRRWVRNEVKKKGEGEEDSGVTEEQRREGDTDWLLLGLFVIGSLMLLICALGWYWPIAHFAERFTLILYACVAYSLFWVVEKVKQWPVQYGGKVWSCLYYLCHGILAVFLWKQVYTLLSYPQFQ